MNYPNLNEEKKLWRKGFEVVVGLDEAGRGALVGPVVAGAVVILNFNFKNLKPVSNFDIRISNLGITDSKKLSEKKREQLYEIITKHPGIMWGVGIVSETVIDKINILEATKLAMKKALRQAQGKPGPKIDYLLLDGNFTLRQAQGRKLIPQMAIVKGDQKVFSIAAASIIAKVTRDRLMQKMHAKYPEYGFGVHKGYGTAAHMAAIKKLGPCKIHRKTFWPISGLAKK